MLQLLMIVPSRWLTRAHRGQGLIEYGMIVILVAIAVMGLLTLLGTQMGFFYSKINSSLATAM